MWHCQGMRNLTNIYVESFRSRLPRKFLQYGITLFYSVVVFNQERDFICNRNDHSSLPRS